MANTNNKDYNVYDLFTDVYTAFKESVNELKKDDNFKELLKDFKAAAYLVKDGNTFKWSTDDEDNKSTTTKETCTKETCINDTPKKSIAKDLVDKFNIKNSQKIQTYISDVQSYIMKNINPIADGGLIYVISNKNTDNVISFGMTIRDNDIIEKIQIINDNLENETTADMNILLSNIQQATGFDIVKYDNENKTFLFDYKQN